MNRERRLEGILCKIEGDCSKLPVGTQLTIGIFVNRGGASVVCEVEALHNCAAPEPRSIRSQITASSCAADDGDTCHALRVR